MAGLKARLVQELDVTFQECAVQAYWSGPDTAAAGNELATRAVPKLMGLLDESRDSIATDQHGYAQVASLMAVVQSELATDKTDYWNGELHEANLPSEMLGFAGPDRALTFDREKVLDVLAAADSGVRSRPSQPRPPTSATRAPRESHRAMTPARPSTTS